MEPVVEGRELVRVPSFDKRAEPVNPRFVRKVLFNHERTQRKLSTCSKKANRVCSLSSEAVEGVKQTVKEWNEAQDNFEKAVHDKF